MAILKFIKPRRIRVDRVEERIIKELEKESAIISKLFDKTTSTWKGNKPTFKRDFKIRQDAVANIIPSGNAEGTLKWTLLELGTPAHPIEARRAPRLIFRHGSGFKAKTRVRTLGSGAGANTGPFVFTKKVDRHPGTQAREWSKEAAKQRKDKFVKSATRAARIWR